MKHRERWTVRWGSVLSGALSALLIAGCTGGGSGGGSTSAAATAQNTSGTNSPLGSSSNGSAQVSATAGAKVSALEPIAADAVLVASPPDLDVLLVGPNPAIEAGPQYPVVSLATVGSDVYAGTGSAGVAGSGDVYLRTPTGWTLSFDGDRSQVVVAGLGADVWAFEGGLGMTAQVSIQSGGQWSSSSTILPLDCIPEQALADGASLWLGAADATGTGGAVLLRGDAGGFAQVVLPAATLAAGEAEHVTGLALDAQGQLVISLATYDAASGQVIGGRVLRQNAQQTFDDVLLLSGNAPLCVVSHQGMLFVGTSGGQLLMESGTTFVEDTNIPVNTGVTRLREATTDTLWVGLSTSSGAAVHTRVSATAGAGAGTGTGTGTPPASGTKLDYVSNIKPLLGTCAGCHTSQSNYRLSAGLANDQADYQATLGVVDLMTPTASRILAKASNTMPHGGGGPWPTNSTAYQTVLAWIQQGAPMTGGTAPATPAVPTNPTYVTDIKPIMSTCVGCHAREDDFRLSANLSDDARDYRTVLGEVSLNTPARSGVVRHPTRQSEHPVKVFDVGSVPYDTLLRWIGNGAPFN